MIKQFNNKELLKFKSLDSFIIKDRGTVYIVESPYTYENGKSNMVGKLIVIDDKKFIVKGIEAYTIPTIHKGVKIGLLVREVE